ncbi:hypothetical protein H2248_009459 [Termitomyces sp. 'cryptogamus']|nr:hypothetical protein H2248_009459 [Termitomyces sp. 'cryptogamus']
MKIPTRCVGFDADGTARKHGCPSNKPCRFTHPDDPGWHTAADPPPFVRASYNRRVESRVDSRVESRVESRVDNRSRHRSPPPSSSSTAPPLSSTVPPSSSTAPSSTAQMPALLPLPTPPDALARKHLPQKNQEQLRALWEERIKALAESTSRRQQLAKIEGEITTTRALMDSLQYPSLPEDSKSRITDELATLERKRDQVKKQREDIINQLIKADSWPATPLTDAQDKELDKYHDMKKSVAELKEQVESINTLFLNLRDSDPDPMHVDERPLKRRRGPESDIPDPGPTKEQLEAMQLRIAELENIYSTFSNDLIARDDDLQQRIEAEVELQLDRAPHPETDVLDQVNADIKQNGEEVDTLVTELAKLMLKADQQEKDLQAVKARIVTSQAQFQEMRDKFQKFEEQRQKDLKTIVALEEAVKMYTDHSPQPAIPGLTQDQIIHLMDEPLIDIVRAHIRPLLEQLRNKVQDMLNMQNSEMYSALWGKLSLTLRMVETISKRLERVDQGSGPAQTSGSAPQNVA